MVVFICETICHSRFYFVFFKTPFKDQVDLKQNKIAEQDVNSFISK